MKRIAGLPAGITSTDLYELARIGWERGNEVSDTPDGFGYGWDEIDSGIRSTAMEEIRVVLVELDRRGILKRE